MKDDGGIGMEEFRDLKNQITSLRAGLTQAKQDLEDAKRTREKLAHARGAAQKEVVRLESQVGRSESQAAAAQESLLKTRRELEETRRKEIRLRDKLKELLEADGGADKLKDLKAMTQKAEHFEKEVELLRAQNLAACRQQRRRLSNLPPLVALLVLVLVLVLQPSPQKNPRSFQQAWALLMALAHLRRSRAPRTSLVLVPGMARRMNLDSSCMQNGRVRRSYRSD